MGRNVFVSYKYADDSVEHLYGCFPTTVRDYVDILATKLEQNGNVYRGEQDGEDLSGLSDDLIYEKLKDKIFNTSCTIVMISPNMKEPGKYDKSQWIPWEVSYSLRETKRSDYTSRRNCILAVVLPDLNGSYDYAMEDKHCCVSGCTNLHTDSLFTILRANMFNTKTPNREICNRNDLLWYGEHSYIKMVRWKDFIGSINYYIETAERIKDNADNYDLHISVNQ